MKENNKEKYRMLEKKNEEQRVVIVELLGFIGYLTDDTIKKDEKIYDYIMRLLNEKKGDKNESSI